MFRVKWHKFSPTVDLSEDTVQSATLTLRVWDVDSAGDPACSAPEVNTVFVNGMYVGYLTGANGVWSTCSFTMSPDIIHDGENQVTIYVDALGSGCSCVTCDYGELDLGLAEKGPEIVSITYEPKSPVTGEDVTFTATVDLGRDSHGKLYTVDQINQW